MNKIALGTVQFGIDYGINNTRGKIPKTETYTILDEALKSDVNVLDTAFGYGDSELIIGNYIQQFGKKFRIISKLPKCKPEEIEKIFYTSKERLQVDRFYGYLFHSSQDYWENPEIWNVMEKLKSENKIEKIGFSLYYPQELERILNNMKIDIVQLPYNIFDQRFEQYFPELKKRKIEIYVRSVFLQGLVFKKPEELDSRFSKIKNKIINLGLLSEKDKIPIVGLCLNFAMVNNWIDKVVIGVDNLDNFKEIMHSLTYYSQVKKISDQLSKFREDDEKIILPMNW